MEYDSPARAQSSSNSGPSQRPSLPCIRVGKSSNSGPSRRLSPSLSSIEIKLTSNFVRVYDPSKSTRVYDPSKSSRHRIRVRVSGPVYHPSENSSHRIRVRVGGPFYPPGPYTDTSFQVIEIQTPSISGRHSGLGRVYHAPKQYLSSIQIHSLSSSNFACLSSNRSLDPPSESEGAPSPDLDNANILRFRLSLDGSRAWSCCDDA